MKMVVDFYRLNNRLLVMVLIVGAFVFSCGCFEDVLGKTTDTEKTVTTDKEDVNYTGPYCTRPLCCGVIICPNQTNNNCRGGCGLVCVETEPIQKVKPSSSPNCTTSQILKTGEEAIISIQGQKLAITVDSFKEYKPSNIDIDSCLRLKWFVLRIKYTNVGDEEIRNPMPKRFSRYDFPFTFVDSKGNELTYPNANANCPQWPVETYDPNPPDEILLPGKTGYYTGKYIFTDNNVVEPEWFKYLPNIRDIQNGAVVHYKQTRCLDDRYDSYHCPNNKTTEDDISWIVFPYGYDEQLTPSPTMVTLALTIDEWGGSGFPQKEAHEIKSLILNVGEGEEFGPAEYSTAYKKTKPFKLLTIIDENHAKIQFDEFLVVVGEPVSNPSQQNPIIVSLDKKCFRTRTSDSGTDFCLKIVK